MYTYNVTNEYACDSLHVNTNYTQELHMKMEKSCQPQITNGSGGLGLFDITRGGRVSTGLSLLCVDVGYKHWSNDRPLCA